MRIPRIAALWAILAIVMAACSSGGSSPSASAGGSAAASGGTSGADCKVGVSWNNFSQPRWAATDQPNIKSAIEDAGGTYVEAFAEDDETQQMTDVENLVNQGINVLILLAKNLTTIGPALQTAADAGVPVIAYDRLIEDPNVLYITFDNTGVGTAEATAMFDKVPTGTYVLIKGDPGDPNASTFLPAGWDEAGLQDKIDSGDITIFDEQFTPDWSPETAQDNMEAIIDSANDQGVQIDAVLAENDSTALGVAAALQAKSYDQIPVSGQDGDAGNLNNVALGWQYVDVWKNSNELGKVAGAAALQLCAGTAIADVTIPDGLIDPSVAPTAGMAAADFTTPGGNTVKSLILGPTPLTAENLNLAVDGGWIDLPTLCDGVTAEMPGGALCAGAASESPAASAAG
jgi:D-xylose transport system substrate-binding protein